jgi:hypothetical protein
MRDSLGNKSLSADRNETANERKKQLINLCQPKISADSSEENEANDRVYRKKSLIYTRKVS